MFVRKETPDMLCGVKVEIDEDVVQAETKHKVFPIFTTMMYSFLQFHIHIQWHDLFSKRHMSVVDSLG
jgi:hypothetical protein